MYLIESLCYFNSNIVVSFQSNSTACCICFDISNPYLYFVVSIYELNFSCFTFILCNPPYYTIYYFVYIIYKHNDHQLLLIIMTLPILIPYYFILLIVCRCIYFKKTLMSCNSFHTGLWIPLFVGKFTSQHYFTI